MDDFYIIKQKLKAFIKKYYLNELLKGISLFLAVWLLYFIIILFVEYFFWLSKFHRSIVFWSFIIISVGLFIRFIVFPLFQLSKITRGIDFFEASKMVGRHFPEVNDKLINVLQLNDSQQQSELLLASIRQKSQELRPVPFSSAINYKTGLKYLKYALFPIIIILALLFTGNFSIFSSSYTRVVHYKTAYTPPAPFHFILPQQNFKIKEGTDLVLKVSTEGRAIPENILINYNNEQYLLKKIAPNKWEYRFSNIKHPINFNLSANNIQSEEYFIEVIQVPRLMDFKMDINYPKYTQQSNNEISGTGNAVIPEGTRITWKMETRATKEINFSTEDTILNFSKYDNNFKLSKRLFSTISYSVNTSNSEVNNYETLNYKIEVIKDQFPELKVEMKRDSLEKGTMYFQGRASDDYAVQDIRLVYYSQGKLEKKSFAAVPFQKGAFSSFISVFPGNLQLEKGTDYQLYFEVFDNDGIHGSKSAKSEIFQYRKKSDKEVESEALQQQAESTNKMRENLEVMKFSHEELKDFSKDERQKEKLSFNDQKKLDNFLKRQKAQEEMMRNYSEKLKKSLQQDLNSDSKQFKEQLKDRFEENEERLKENEELLKELQKYSNKINKEDLNEKLDDLAKRNSSRQKSLKRLLELTKKYYISRKSIQLVSNLEQLAQEQQKLAEDDSLNSSEKQKELNTKFDQIANALDGLNKENKELVKPVNLPRNKEMEENISKEQQKAEDNLQKQNTKNAKQHQKSAAEKMKKLAQEMKSAQAMGEGQQLNADISSMRKILDNLLTFSFEQEDLLNDFKGMKINNPSYARGLREQQVLKEHFEHIDDSIFSLALSNPMISDKITSQLTDIQYDINNSLERLSQNELSPGTASQRYVMTGTNKLANMLDDILSNMQEMANPNPGKGGGKEGIQLPDIIQSQEQLNSKLGKQIQEKHNNDDEGINGKEPGSSSAEENGKLYEIYKEQQELRNKLREKLQELGIQGNAPLLEEMKLAEQEILDKGFNKETFEKMNNIKEKMLKLKDAVNIQEFGNERESKTNRKEFMDTTQNQINKAKEYFNSSEILNRHILPLRQNYKSKVRKYFEIEND